jgi:hypothetical protein
MAAGGYGQVPHFRMTAGRGCQEVAAFALVTACEAAYLNVSRGKQEKRIVADLLIWLLGLSSWPVRIYSWGPNVYPPVNIRNLSTEKMERNGQKWLPWHQHEKLLHEMCASPPKVEKQADVAKV